MIPIKPKLTTTISSPDNREWIPDSFKSFQLELEHIISSCEGTDPLPLFRGQTNSEWRLDSSFVRNFIQKAFSIDQSIHLNASIRQSIFFHRLIAYAFLFKFNILGKPHQELFDHENLNEIDPWFEFIKNLQQYPEKDYPNFIKGTFLLDWTSSKEVALYFATYTNKGSERHLDSNQGALWVYDAVATGATLQIGKLDDIFKKMLENRFLNGEKTFPLIFHPEIQIAQPRAKNQSPIYIAQMNFSFDLAGIWAQYEKQKAKKVFIKLILKNSLKKDAAEYLTNKGFTETSIYPV